MSPSQPSPSVGSRVRAGYTRLRPDRFHDRALVEDDDTVRYVPHDGESVCDLLGGEQALRHARTPAIVADAAYAILTPRGEPVTGRTLIDDEVLRERGVTDFGRYAVSGVDADLEGDFFLD